MSPLLVVACAFAIVLQFAQSNASREQFELREGNCSRTVLGDLVFHDHVHLTRLPFLTRSTKSSFNGHLKIYCIQALSAKDASKGSTVSIKEGGLNYTYVTLEFHSKKNHGLEYNIQVFGKD